MSNPIFETGKQALQFSRNALMAMIDKIPEDKRCYQCVPGGNHVLWVMGHMSIADNGFRTKFSDQESVIPESYQKLFGRESTPSSQESDYPSFEELKESMNKSRKALLDWFSTMDEEKLNEVLPEDYQMFAPTIGDLMGAIAVHEGLHAGQLTMNRKGLGLDPAWG